MKNNEHLKRVRPGIIEIDDPEGLTHYIAQRESMNTVNNLQQQINILSSDMNEIKNMLQQLIKAT